MNTTHSYKTSQSNAAAGLLGAAVGAAAAIILSDDKTRRKLVDMFHDFRTKLDTYYSESINSTSKESQNAAVKNSDQDEKPQESSNN